MNSTNSANSAFDFSLTFADLFQDTKYWLTLSMLNFFTPTDVFLMSLLNKSTRKNIIKLTKQKALVFKSQLEILNTIYKEYNRNICITIPRQDAVFQKSLSDMVLLNSKLWEMIKSTSEKLAQVSDNLKYHEFSAIHRIINKQKKRYQTNFIFYPEAVFQNYSHLREELSNTTDKLNFSRLLLGNWLLAIRYQAPAYQALLMAYEINQLFSEKLLISFDLENIDSWRETYNKNRLVLKEISEWKALSYIIGVLTIITILLLAFTIGLIYLTGSLKEASSETNLALFSIITTVTLILFSLGTRITYECNQLKPMLIAFEKFDVKLDNLENIIPKNSVIRRNSLFFLPKESLNAIRIGDLEATEEIPLLRSL